MSETVFALITSYGPWVIFLSAFLSCLALPIPTSLMMLTGGAFVAVGDLEIAPVMLSAFLGAVAGDQTGWLLGKYGGTPLFSWLTQAPSRAAVLEKAHKLVDRRGGVGVFLSTWAVAPLGPWVNFIAGATGLSWVRFTIADILGEMVWVVVYVGLGYTFAANVSAVADIAGNVAGLLAALVVSVAMILWIRGVLRNQHRLQGKSSG